MHRKYTQFHLQSLKIKFTGTTSPVCLHFHAMTELNSCNQENRTVNPTVFAFWPSQKSLCPPAMETCLSFFVHASTVQSYGPERRESCLITTVYPACGTGFSHSLLSDIYVKRLNSELLLFKGILLERQIQRQNILTLSFVV